MSDDLSQEYEALRCKLEPGTSWHLHWNEGNPNNRFIHIRAIVDDMQVVSRYWSYHSRQWVYEIDSLYWYYLLDSEGTLLAEKSGGSDD